MGEQQFRVGDVVRVTARITSLRGDGSYVLEPLGFDYSVRDENGHVPDMDCDVTHFTVDPPEMEVAKLYPGDRLWDAEGRESEYVSDNGDGWHLLRYVDPGLGAGGRGAVPAESPYHTKSTGALARMVRASA